MTRWVDELLARELPPVRVGLADVSGDILPPFLRDFAGDVQVQLPVYDLPIARIAVELSADRHAVGAVASISRLVRRGMRLELVEVRLRGEAISGCVVHGGETRVARRGHAVLEVGDDVVAVDREAGGDLSIDEHGACRDIHFGSRPGGWRGKKSEAGGARQGANGC